ncbi:MAG: hypothetical protein AAF170_02275 [Bacteroidota bacterium]
MPTDLCPDNGALRGGRGASLTRRRARRRHHQRRARQARARREAASHRWRYAWVRQLDVELVPLDPPHFAGYVREFIPAVPDTHPDHADLLLLLDAGLQRIAYDHIRAFTHPTIAGRRHKRGSTPVQTLRRLCERDWLKLPLRLQDLFDPIPRWHSSGRVAYWRYRFRYPDLYRLRVRQLWITHRAVPSEAVREQQSVADRYWFKAPYYRDLYYQEDNRWRWIDRELERERRRARRDIEGALDDLPDEMTRQARIRV